MEHFFHQMFLIIDTLLITPYRWPINPATGFFLGTIMLAGYCILLGKLTGYFVEKCNKTWVQNENRRMVYNHNQSLRALLAKNKKAYKGFNKDANDAFGKYFFNRMACGMSTLWPAFFALAWLDTRFTNVDFILPVSLPVIGGAVGYSFIFIALYILCVILSKQLFKSGSATGTENESEAEKMLTMNELIESSR